MTGINVQNKHFAMLRSASPVEACDATKTYCLFKS